MIRIVPALLLLVSATATSADPPLRDGDRVVLIGSTLIEREGSHGYWEAALTARNPKANVTFRNLGWSGDTVWGEARAEFGSAADGFNKLRAHVLGLKPTVIVLGYGTNESFAGPAGVSKFEPQLRALLDALAPTKARLVVLSPPRFEDMGRPLPDPSQANVNLALYRDALRDEAKKRGATFVDLFEETRTNGKCGGPRTDNGLHQTALGYWTTAGFLAEAIGLPAVHDRIEASTAKAIVTDASLMEMPPHDSGPIGRTVLVKGLAAGQWTLKIDGKAVATATDREWAEGVISVRGPEYEQFERLRRTIVAKNELYFHRWRPANVTYLFGFRKHEQGNNAREMPMFDPLIDAKEQEIARLRVPVAHTYEWVPEAK